MSEQKKRGFYDYVQIPVALCWNNDYGNFAGEIVKIDIHDSLEIETRYVNDDYSCAGLECTSSMRITAGWKYTL
jgi:hypothetical protein